MKLLTPEDAAARLPRTSVQAVYRLANNRTIPDEVIVRVGRKLFFREDRFHEWLASGGTRLEGGWKGRPSTAEVA